MDDFRYSINRCEELLSRPRRALNFRLAQSIHRVPEGEERDQVVRLSHWIENSLPSILNLLKDRVIIHTSCGRGTLSTVETIILSQLDTLVFLDSVRDDNLLLELTVISIRLLPDPHATILEYVNGQKLVLNSNE